MRELNALKALVREIMHLVDDGTLPLEAVDHPAMIEARAAITAAEEEGGHNG